MPYDGWTHTEGEQGWEDMVVQATAQKIPAVRGAPMAQVGTSNTYLPQFGKDDQLYFSLQMSHGYRPNDDLRMHIHWLPITGNTGRVAWKVDYNIATVAATFSGGTVLSTGADLYDSGAGASCTHQITPTHTVSGGGLKESFCVFGTITRLSSADTYTSSPFLVSMDLHYLKYKRGTPAEWPT